MYSFNEPDLENRQKRWPTHTAQRLGFSRSDRLYDSSDLGEVNQHKRPHEEILAAEELVTPVNYSVMDRLL